jgi:membrane protein DedA with SNARE-associated domain
MPWRQTVGAIAWASAVGFAAYMLGRRVERVAGPMFMAIGLVALILIVVSVISVGQREGKLMAAERALPKPLKDRCDRPGD